MYEYLARLKVAPGLALQLVFASLLANILALAVPLFVIQVMSRFLSVGVASTLATLALGTCAAVGFEVMLRNSRFRLARAHLAIQDYHMTVGTGRLLTEADPPDVAMIQAQDRQNPIDALNRIQQTYSPHNLCTLLDLPFALMFAAVVMMIDYRLGAVILVSGAILMIAMFWISRMGRQSQTRAQREIQSISRQLQVSALHISPLRSFLSSHSLRQFWNSLAGGQSEMIGTMSKRVVLQQNVTTALQALQSMAVISVGALISLNGDLDIGALIGVNILAARALMPISRASSLFDAVSQAREGKALLAKVSQLAAAAQKSGTPLLQDLERIELVKLAAQGVDAPQPSFNGLTTLLKPNQVVVVRCANDLQMNEFRSLFTGLMSPRQGAVLFNGVNIKQLPFEWLRLQTGYIAARPQFHDATIADNFQYTVPGERDDILKALEAAGLRAMIEAHPQGLDMRLLAQPEQLTLDHRWRFGLARVIYLNPPVILLEDPEEAIGKEAASTMDAWPRALADMGKLTIFMTKSDRSIPGIDQEIRLNRPPQVSSARAVNPAAMRATNKIVFNPMRLTEASADENSESTRQLVRAKRAAQALTLTVCAFVTTLCVWTYFGKLDRISFITGKVVPSLQVQTVESLEGGIVRDIHVNEGDSVKQGDPVVTLEAVSDAASIGELDARLVSLRIAKIRLEAQIARRKQLTFPDGLAESYPELVAVAEDHFTGWRERLRLDLGTQLEIVSQRQDQTHELDIKIESLDRELALATEQEKISQDLLEASLTSRMDHLTLQRNRSRLISDLSAAKAQRATAQSALREARETVNLLESTAIQGARSELDIIIRDLNELQNRMAKLVDTKERRILRAPIDGTVKSLSTFTQAAVIQPGEVAAEIVPEDDKLIVEANLPIADIGFVNPGMPVNIRLASSDAYRFAPIIGAVDRLSPDTFSDERGRAFYRIYISADIARFENRHGETYTLVPGLQVSGGIIVGERSVFSYLAEPILRGINTAFRER